MTLRKSHGLSSYTQVEWSGVMAVILRYFTEFGSQLRHCVEVRPVLQAATNMLPKESTSLITSLITCTEKWCVKLCYLALGCKNSNCITLRGRLSSS